MKYDSIYSALLAVNEKIGGQNLNFDSEYSIWENIYTTLGGSDKNFDSIYSIISDILGDSTTPQPTPQPIDWSVIGYDEQDVLNVLDIYDNPYEYAEQIYNNWNPNAYSYGEMFLGDDKLTIFPKVQMNSCIDVISMFEECVNLKSLSLNFPSTLRYADYLVRKCNLLEDINIVFSPSNIVLVGIMMFSNCEKLKNINITNPIKVQNMGMMCYSCPSLINGPSLDTSEAYNFGQAFEGCRSLQSLPLYDASGVIDNSNNTSPFGGRGSTTTLNSLTDIGGFKNLKMSWDRGFLSLVPNLTHQSLMNVINNLYDLASEGSSGTLDFGTTNLNKLTEDEIAIAINKGWTLS